MVSQISHIIPHCYQKELRLRLCPAVSLGKGSQAKCRSSLKKTLHFKCAYKFHPLVFGPWRGRNFVPDLNNILEAGVFQIFLEIVWLTKRPTCDCRGIADRFAEDYDTVRWWSAAIVAMGLGKEAL
jgi:hypothetical protein